MIVVVNPFLFKILPNSPMAMALFPLVLIDSEKNRHNQILLNHEKIHLRQQKELLILPFYVLYLLNYFVNLLIYRNHRKAYFNICFEREAYRHEADMGFLKARSFCNFLKFLRKD